MPLNADGGSEITVGSGLGVSSELTGESGPVGDAAFPPSAGGLAPEPRAVAGGSTTAGSGESALPAPAGSSVDAGSSESTWKSSSPPPRLPEAAATARDASTKI